MDEEAMHAAMLDIEEELVKFTVRSGKPRKVEQPVRRRDYKIETPVIPLLIRDIHQLKLPDKSFTETITAYGYPFGNALLYGRILPSGAGANEKLRYSLDDGTGVIKVKLVAHSALKEINKQSLECFRMFGHKKELYNSVQNILKLTRKQLLDVGILPYGTRVAIIGRPYRLFDDIVFSVFEMVIDTDPTNEMEIAVKNLIIDWYTTQYTSNELKYRTLNM